MNYLAVIRPIKGRRSAANRSEDAQDGRRCQRGASWNRRRGAFSLLEVILAIAILGGSMAVLDCAIGLRMRMKCSEFEQRLSLVHTKKVCWAGNASVAEAGNC